MDWLVRMMGFEGEVAFGGTVEGADSTGEERDDEGPHFVFLILNYYEVISFVIEQSIC